MTHFAGPEEIIAAALERYHGYAFGVLSPTSECVVPMNAPTVGDILRGRTGEERVGDELTDPVRSTLRLLVRDQAWQMYAAGGDLALFAMISRIETRMPDPWYVSVLERWIEGVGRMAA